MSNEPSSAPRRTNTLVVAAALAGLAAVAAAVVAVAVMGSSRSDPEAKAASQSAGTPTAGSPSPPALPSSRPRATWARLVDHHIVVGGKRVPGTWDSVASKGHTWLASKEDEGSETFWGTGRHPHALADMCCDPALSPDGRWIAYATSNSPGGFLRLVDTTTARLRELRVPADYAIGVGVADVTNGGVVLVWGCATGGSNCPGSVTAATVTLHVWVPDRGRLSDVRHYTDARALQAGFVLDDPVRARTDLVRIDAHGRLHVVAHIPQGVAGSGYAERMQFSIDPSATWLVTNATRKAERRTHIAIRPLRGGSVSLLPAPPGWRFENVGYDYFSWESDDLFVDALWKPGSPDAWARCSIRLSACVLIDE